MARKRVIGTGLYGLPVVATAREKNVRRPRRVRPTGAFANPAGGELPVARVQRQTRERAQRAQRRTPSPAPRQIPRAQRQAAGKAIARDVGRRPERSGLAKALDVVLRNHPGVLANRLRRDVISPALGAEAVERALDRELEGRGLLAKAGEFAGRSIDRSVVVPTGGGPAGVRSRRAKGTRVAAAIASPPVKTPAIVERAAKDLANLPAVAVPSLYVPAAAAVEAVDGRPQRLKQLAKDIDETDPLYALARGQFAKAARLANEHPGFAAAQAFGVKGTIGRGAGRAVRGGAVVTRSQTLRRLGSTTSRLDATRPGTGLRETRRYSRDLITKGRQVAQDRYRIRQAEKLRARANEVESTDAAAAVELRRRANRVDPTMMTDAQIARRVDLLEQANFQRQRREVGDVDAKVQEIIRQSKARGAGLSLVTQGITRADVGDLRAYRDEIAAEFPKLVDPAKRAANVQLRREIDETIKQAQGRRGAARLQALERARDRYVREVREPLERELAESGLLPRARGERAILIAGAARSMRDKEFRVDEKLGAVVRRRDGGWRQVTNDEMRRAARRQGVNPDLLGYLTQGPRARSAGDYYRSSAREPVIGAAARTERPTREGTFDADPEMLRAGAMNSANLVTAARNYRGFLAEVATRGKGGKNPAMFMSRQRADDVAKSLHQSSGMEWQVVRAQPFGATRQQFEAMLDAVGEAVDDPRVNQGVRDAISDALQGQDYGGGYMVVPRAAARQAEQHLKVLGPTDADRALRTARSAFTRTVLSLSPGPTLGNAVEGSFRMMVARAGPRSYLTAGRVLKALAEEDPQLANALADRTMPGGKVALATRQRYFDPKQLGEGRMRRFVALWQAGKRAPVGKQVATAWQMWTHLVFDQINGRLESGMQKAQLGAAIRRSGLMDDHMMRLSNKAVREAARGLTDTAVQASMARDVYDAYGKYAGFSPAMRKTIAEYTPFAAWMLSSVNFLTRVLPRDHPTLVALIAASEQWSQEWLADQGLGLFLRGDGKLPGWMQGTIQAGDFGRVQATRHTPFSLGTDPLGSLANSVLPQFSSLLNAMQGLDWKNQKLRHEDGREYDDYEKMGYGLRETLKSSVPIVAVPDRAAKYLKDPQSLLSPVRIKPREKKAAAGGGFDFSRARPVQARGFDFSRARPAGG